MSGQIYLFDGLDLRNGPLGADAQETIVVQALMLPGVSFPYRVREKSNPTSKVYMMAGALIATISPPINSLSGGDPVDYIIGQMSLHPWIPVLLKDTGITVAIILGLRLLQYARIRLAYERILDRVPLIYEQLRGAGEPVLRPLMRALLRLNLSYTVKEASLAQITVELEKVRSSYRAGSPLETISSEIHFALEWTDQMIKAAQSVPQTAFPIDMSRVFRHLAVERRAA